MHRRSGRIGLSVRGRDYVYTGGASAGLSNTRNTYTGCGPLLHSDPRDRPVERFGGETTIHLGAGRENYVLLPIVPALATGEKPEIEDTAARKG